MEVEKRGEERKGKRRGGDGSRERSKRLKEGERKEKKGGGDE